MLQPAKKTLAIAGESMNGADFERRLCNDFVFFLVQLWQERKWDRHSPLGEMELDIGDYAANGDPSIPQSILTRVILAPRSIGKTHLVTAALALFRLLRDPDRKILIISKSADEAKKTLKLIRNCIASVWFLNHLLPTDAHLDSSTKFDVGVIPASEEGRQPSVTALGVDGQLEGNRAHTILGDDVETAKNTITIDAREELDERIKECKDIIYPARAYEQGGPIDPCEIIFVGTYHNEESLYQKLNQRDYVVRTWSLVAPHPEDKILNLAPIIQRKIDAGELKPSSAPEAFDGDCCFSPRLGKEHVLSKQKEGRLRFAMQHMLISNLSSTNRYPLRLSDLIVADVNRDKAPISYGYGKANSKGSTGILDVPSLGLGSDRLFGPVFVDEEFAPYTTTRARVDPAGIGDDMTGLAIVSHLGGFFHVKYCRGHTGGKDADALERIARLLRLHGCRECEVETNNDVYDSYFPALELAVRKLYLEPGQDPSYPAGWKCSMIRVRSTLQKELRIINVLETPFSTHRVIIDRASLIPSPDEDVHQTLQYQITRITKQRKALKEDGAIDALAGAISGFTDTLRIDHEARRQKTVEEEIDRAAKFLHGLSQVTAAPPNFLHPE